MNNRTIIIAIIVVFGFATTSSGQIRKAKKEMELFNYTGAIEILAKSLTKKDPDEQREATLLMADCYRKQHDLLNTRAWYARVISLGNVKSINYFYYAQALRSSGDYKLAKEMFIKYAELEPNDPRGKLYADFCDSVNVWRKIPSTDEVKLAQNLNTRQSDFGPVWYDQGIVFTSDRFMKSEDKETYGWTGQGYLKLFSSQPIIPDDFTNAYQEPVYMEGLLNQDYHDGPATFSPNGKEIYLNRTYVYKDKPRKDRDHIRTHLLKIFYAKIKDNKWSKLEPFFLNNDNYSIGHPSLSTDGLTLYFVSDMPGGFGGTDIYRCTRAGEKWSKPENLGAIINTFGNEMFPTITEPGDLYFSSDGLPGYGGLDLFITRQTDHGWLTPQNLHEPMNSSVDDFAIALAKDSTSGLFSSNRPGGVGSDDIYTFRKTHIELVTQTFFSGCVKDKQTLEPIENATVFIRDNRTLQVLILKSNPQGCFKTQVENGSSYTIKAMQAGYIADCYPLPVDPANTLQDLSAPRDLLLDKLQVNKTFKLENIYYDLDKYNIRTDAAAILDNLVNIMRENPINIELGSHTDSRASDDYNLDLSQKRAESAVRYLVLQGINPARMVAKGYGERQLVNGCSNGVPCSEAEHQQNRRTEFKVVSWFDDQQGETFSLDLYQAGTIIDSRLFPADFFSHCSLTYEEHASNPAFQGQLIEKSTMGLTEDADTIETSIQKDAGVVPDETVNQKPEQTETAETPEKSLETLDKSTLKTIPTYYIIILSGISKTDADKLVQNLRAEGYKDAKLVDFTGKMRISLYESTTINEALRLLKDARTTYPEAWVLKWEN